MPSRNFTAWTVWLTTCQIPVIFLLTYLHFLSCSFLCFFWHVVFLYLSIFLVYLFPSSFFIGKSKINTYLELGFKAAPLTTALHAINSTQCISVRCLTRDVSDSSAIFLSTCLHCLSFSFLFVLLACCLSLPILIVFYHPLLGIKEKYALRIWIQGSPLSIVLPAVNSTQYTVWLTTCQIPVLSSF